MSHMPEVEVPPRVDNPIKPSRNVSILIKASLSLAVTLILAVVLVLVMRHQQAGAVASIAGTVDDAQLGIPYAVQLQAISDTGGVVLPAGIATFTNPDGKLALVGLGISAGGLISGTPSKVKVGYTFNVQVTSPGEATFLQTYSITIYGRLTFQFGPPAVDLSVRTTVPGATNVTMCTFVVQALGEDIRLNKLKFTGMGTGQETFDVQRVTVWSDRNNNSLVDSGDFEILTGGATFSVVQGFNPSVTFGGAAPGIGYIIDSHLHDGFDTFIVAYNFTGTVEAARTFRNAFVQPSDIGWDCMFSGGVAWITPTNSGTVFTTFLGNTTTSYKGAVMTITGPPPAVPTLYMSDGGNIDGNTVAVATGATNVAALPLTFWADSSHSILIDQIKITDSGSGFPSVQITDAKLYYDLDHDGAFSAGDLLLTTATFTNNSATFSNLNLLVTTPSAGPTDAGAVNLLVTYNLNSLAAPPATFQARIVSKTDVVAHELVTNGVVDLQDTSVPMAGNVITVVSGAFSTLSVDTGNGGIYGTLTSVANNAESVPVWRGRFWASQGHRIRLTSLRFTASGSLDDKFDISSVRLIKDRDNSGSVSQGDVELFQTTAFFLDNDSLVVSLNEIIETPTGTSADTNALNLLLVYNLNGNAPVVQTPDSIAFTASLLAVGDIAATLADTVGAVNSIQGPPVYGTTVRIDTYGVAPVLSSGAGPFVTNATFYDADTSSSVNTGDYIIVAFDTNLAPTSAANVNIALPDFILPVVGDGFGAGAAVGFQVGNKMKITLGAGAFLTIPGIYATGADTAGSASGINTKDTVTTITSIYGRSANQATASRDIGGSLAAVTTASGPFPTRAQFTDADTSYGVSAGDAIVVTFSENITPSAVTSAHFTPLPVIGDFFGISAPTITQTRGDQLTIQFTSQPTLTVAGGFSAASLGAGSPSGINLSGITNAIKDSAGRSAVPAAAILDIEGLDTGSADSAPRPNLATYYDLNADGIVSAGDVIDLSFNKNVILTGAVPANKLFMPKIGDLITGATIAQFGGNKLRITVGAGDTFRVSGVFTPADLTEAASSGINLLSTIATIQDLSGRSAVPAAVALDIAVGTSGFSDASSGSSGSTGTGAAIGKRGDAACVISRTPFLKDAAPLSLLRTWRDVLLTSSVGRSLTLVYYLL